MKILKNKTYNSLVAQISSLENMYNQDTLSLKEQNKELELQLEFIKKSLEQIIKQQKMSKDKMVSKIASLVVD